MPEFGIVSKRDIDIRDLENFRENKTIADISNLKENHSRRAEISSLELDIIKSATGYFKKPKVI